MTTREELHPNTPVFAIDDAWGLKELEQAKNDLQHWMLDLDEEIGSIKSQINSAKTAAFDGQCADHSWWVRANDALRHKSRQRQSYQLSLGEINRRLRSKRGEASADMFIAAARDLLPPETVKMIFDEMWRRQRATSKGGKT